VAGPTNVKPVQFKRAEPAPAVPLTAADVRHARLQGGVIGLMAGLALMFAIIWTATMWTADTTVDTFGRGVAIGKAMNHER
jgi:hypothetical protein